jgi:hypothetical protein
VLLHNWVVIKAVLFIIHMASGLSHLFVSWLWGIRKDLKQLVSWGVAATSWSLWLCRTDVVFDKKKKILLTIYLLTHWLHV